MKAKNENSGYIDMTPCLFRMNNMVFYLKVSKVTEFHNIHSVIVIFHGLKEIGSVV